MNQLWQTLASKQIDGEVMSVEEITYEFGYDFDEMEILLTEYKAQGYVDFLWLDEAKSDVFLYLTKAVGFETYKLLLPAITDETIFQDWAKQIYPLLLQRFLNDIMVPEAKDWRDICFPVYAATYFMSKAEEIGEGIMIGIIQGFSENLKPEIVPKGNTFIIMDEYKGPDFLPCIDVDSLSKD